MCQFRTPFLALI